MNYIVVAGPDKLAISMFIRFLRNSFGPGHRIGEMHSMMSEDSVRLYMDDFSRKYPKGFISYYAGRKINVDPMKSVPAYIVEKADVVVWFDLYSTEMKVVKDPENRFALLLGGDWKSYIDKFNG